VWQDVELISTKQLTFFSKGKGRNPNQKRNPILYHMENKVR